jgi:hypothetical protein
MGKNKRKITDSIDENSSELEEDKEVSLKDSFSAKSAKGKKDAGKKTKKDDALTTSTSSAQDSVVISKSKVVLVKKLLSNIKENSDKLSQILAGFISEEDEALISVGQASDGGFELNEVDTGEGKITEGVFDGENMIGPDGKQYSVPANYASKSKLVEGDILKLTITPKGTFVYKQISPIERTRVIGRLEKGSDGNFYVIADSKKWRVLTASVTYFKGESGDETVILIPKTGDSRWAAVENIVRNR